MTEFESEALIRWLAGPPAGVPRLTVGSGSLIPSLPLSVDAGAAHPLATSPGELLAGAIGTMFAWFAAEELLEGGTRARELLAEVILTVSERDQGVRSFVLSGIVVRLRGRVPDIDQERLDAVAQEAADSCLDTLGLRTDGLTLTAEAMLEGG